MESQDSPRKSYPTDLSDDAWAFVAPYLTLTTVDGPQCRRDLREVFNDLRWIVHSDAPWRYPDAGVFVAMMHGLCRDGARRA